MRGRPLWQGVVFAAVWLLLALPIHRVTRAVPAAEPAAEPSSSVAVETVPAWVELRFSRPPSSFQLIQGDTVLWAEAAPQGGRFERSLPLVLDAAGAELRLVAALPGEGETAIEVAVEPDGRARRSAVLWIEGDVDDPLFFRWEAR